jgi:hypothetical protein
MPQKFAAGIKHFPAVLLTVQGQNNSDLKTRKSNKANVPSKGFQKSCNFT